MSLIVGIQEGKLWLWPDGGGDQGFELTDIEGAARFLLKHRAKNNYMCASSCNHPQEEGAPEGFEFTPHLRAIWVRAEEIQDEEHPPVTYPQTIGKPVKLIETAIRRAVAAAKKDGQPRYIETHLVEGPGEQHLQEYTIYDTKPLPEAGMNWLRVSADGSTSTEA